MKKTFNFHAENKHPDRVLEGIKYEIRKYLKRERKKKLPEDALFWDFDCRFGKDTDNAEALSVSEIIAALDRAKAAQWDRCYVEIIAKASEKNTPVQSSEAESS